MLGKKLEKLVQESTFTNAHIVDYLGVSVNTLYNLYKKESFDTAIVTKSCELFNVPLSYFLGGIAENIEVSKKLDVEDNAEISVWSRKYLEAQEKVNKLQDEVSKIKSELIAFQKEAYQNQREAFQQLAMNLGKAKASSKKATLSKQYIYSTN